ncbi:ATP-dependent Clp protease ATP-binding subunit [Embleya scabrispora]|uniref:ATP-dependent Clp protease ATP-binding subunit n=1 Tax=Embleya scabrispora TaxID=159449 RepID=UPI00131A11C9|nr:ATP-dependent Clp protease ATP-binding subunit [Embleya scabrispora]MYS82344.1 AAA domain-containing protein [Streptomyces sp. SID5474]
MDTDILGVPEQVFDSALLAATRRFAGAAAVARELGADTVEVAHALIALARIDGGRAAGLFDRQGIPPDVLAAGLLGGGGLGAGSAGSAGRAGSEPHSNGRSAAGLLGGLPVTADLRIAFTAAADTGYVDERALLAELLPRLEVGAVDLLVGYGRVDLAAWQAEVATPRPAVEVLRSDGSIDPAAFGPGARRVLAMMATEAAGLGHERCGIALLLHALATTPGGLLEQAFLFLRRDVRALREQTIALTGTRGRTAPGTGPAGPDESLRSTLRRAAAFAATRADPGADPDAAGPITERDLLAALLDTPSGLAAGFFRDIGLDLDRLRRFADTYYREPAAPEPTRAVEPLSPEEAVRWVRSRLIGQESVVERLAFHIELIKRSLTRGFRPDDRPRAALLLCGPSGSGKTMTARLLAQVVYGSEEDVLVFEMGQFSARESINNFIGAPPGYVGFGEGKLTNGLRDNPRRVFLFDEVEKADARVLDALLRLLDEGRISDPAGPVREAHDAVVILTTNLGATHSAAEAVEDDVDSVENLIGSILAEGSTGNTAASARLRRTMEGFFRPEFLNRVDEVILYSPFGPTELRGIAENGLIRLAARLREQIGVELGWTDEAAAHIATVAWRGRPEEAARGVNRCVNAVVPSILRLLDEGDAAGRVVTSVRVRVAADTLVVGSADD